MYSESNVQAPPIWLFSFKMLPQKPETKALELSGIPRGNIIKPEFK